jgi:hypothetical protein
MPEEYGKKIWFFPDGDLPPAGELEPKGHESLVILNPNLKDASVTMTVYFTDRQPVVIQPLTINAQRVQCIRVDKPVNGFQIPFGQYALKIESTIGIIAQIGRMDVRQSNLAYYTTMGYPS